jgi:flagellar biosynthesis repressor protein FlbT
MLIHLKRNERLFINGAVLRLDRRGTIELLNDAQFLLENHIMQAEGATTPMRQLYFVVQTMIMDPVNAHLTNVLFKANALQIELHTNTEGYRHIISTVRELVEHENFFEALKMLRKYFDEEDKLLNRGTSKCNKESVAA